MFDIHDYFDNNERRKGNVQDALSKSIALSPAVHPDSHVYVVEFKAGRKDIFYLPSNSSNEPVIREGDCVIVEADRGTDLGKLVEITPETVSDLLQGHGLYSSQLITSLTNFSLKRIYRSAHSAEILMIVSKNEEEKQAMKLAQEKAIEKGLPMDIVNVEYQWDRRKLTFFYISLVYIDFRELVRELYRTYKTRIWFVRYNDIKESL
jgi:cell fate regulator YaaT (PSP1 superfamily)